MMNSISIILPLFNEERRLKRTFDKIANFSNKNKIKFKEFIFVNDGSTDNSSNLIEQFIKKNLKLSRTKLRLIKLKKNIGKGGALKKGVKVATGNWILTSDIDFSVSLFELEKWQRKKLIKKFNNVYFGSRSHINSVVNSKWYRRIIGALLRVLISFFLGIKIKDTQCGFKLYEKKIAKKIFSKIKFLGYEHDIEIVLLLKRNKIKILELPVTWDHVDYSKVNLISDSIKIFLKIISIKFFYIFIA